MSFDDAMMSNDAPPIAIGDLQGCLDPLLALLGLVERDAPDRPLWFCGDLVNRGPQSLDALRFVKSLGDRAVAVLGNHDLHLLAVAHGLRAPSKSDTLQPILDAPDRDELLDWLRHRPLAHHAHGHLLVHAGVLPQWTLDQALRLARDVEADLRDDDYVGVLRTMYGNTPARWDDGLQGDERRRIAINAFTRLRFCAADGTMDFEAKESADAAPPGLMPWFEVPDRRTHDVPIVFGHWSTLGFLQRSNVLALDTGCVWGGGLTAAELGPRARTWRVPCRAALRPTRG